MFRLLNKKELSYTCKCYVGKLLFDIKCGCLNFLRRKSYYQVLGLDSSASVKDIKSAYYRLSLEFHPDKNKGSPDSVSKFREISEAYEVLSNPEKKRSYDLSGNFKTNYSHFDAQTGYYYKPYANRRSNNTYTGKTKDFDYDEHFRRHYEYEKQRQVEYEYFKRRWKAEQRRTNPNREEYYRNQYNQDERDSSYEEISRFRFHLRRAMIYLVPVWGLFFLVIPIFTEFHNPERRKRYGPLYYVIKNDDNDSEKDK